MLSLHSSSLQLVHLSFHKQLSSPDSEAQTNKAQMYKNYAHKAERSRYCLTKYYPGKSMI